MRQAHFSVCQAQVNHKKQRETKTERNKNEGNKIFFFLDLLDTFKNILNTNEHLFQINPKILSSFLYKTPRKKNVMIKLFKQWKSNGLSRVYSKTAKLCADIMPSDASILLRRDKLDSEHLKLWDPCYPKMSCCKHERPYY